MVSEVVAIVLIILFIFVILVLALLLIPFHLVVSASTTLSMRKFDIAVSWLGLTLWRNKPSKAKEGKKEAEEKGGGIDFKRTTRMLALFRDSIPALSILVRYIRKAVHLRYLSLDFTFGLGDPAETAIAAGYLWSFAWIVNSLPSVTFSFRPVFESIRLDSFLRAEARVRMLFLVIGFLGAYTKKPFRELIKEVRRGR